MIRISTMMRSCDILLEAPRSPALGRLSFAFSSYKGRNNAVTDTAPPEHSEQTAWMLAIRDTRDKQAFAQLFDYFAPRLKGMFMRAGTRPDTAEDIVQDVMLTVWHKASQFDPQVAQVSAWVYKIARNRQIDIARKTKRPLPDEIGPDEEASDDTQQVYALEQEVRILRRALEKLSSDQRQIIEKAYLGELSHSEIRDDTGLPLGTIKSRIRLGLERLRHELKELR
jgi:RNA polymerase sigma-70 factor (ECF subfamily)